jgi:poly(3-hydroxybutyrate) depolymerase
MAWKGFIVAGGIVAAFSPVAAAAQPDRPVAANEAPAGTPDTRYCMKVDPLTGSLVETIRCWTRDEWADQGVDVDKEWAKNGVKVETPVTA